jgi:pyruvate dehydrogenase E1 component
MADQLARGFLIGATAGRTTLTGEGLQHADGHSPLLALTNPAVVHYDPAFAYEIAHIVQDGLRRMYGSSDGHPHGEDVIYYLTVYNEPISQPVEPEGLDVEGLLKGMYHLSGPLGGVADDSPRVPLLAWGGGRRWTPRAPDLRRHDWGVAADLWSVTSWNELSREALATEEWNLMHPLEEPRSAYVTEKVKDAPGPVVAVSDYMRAVPQTISRWIPQRFHALGADGFGFADTRAAARRFFKIDAESVVCQALAALAEEGRIGRDAVQKALDHYRIDDPTAVSGVKQEGGDA